MKTYMPKIVAFLNDEEGATAVEYALLVGMIAIAIIAGAKVLGPEIVDALTRIQGKLATNVTGY